MEDLQSASKLLSKAMKIRERYMNMSRQKFPTLVKDYLRGAKGFPEEGQSEPGKATLEGKIEIVNQKILFEFSLADLLTDVGTLM